MVDNESECTSIEFGTDEHDGLLRYKRKRRVRFSIGKLKEASNQHHQIPNGKTKPADFTVTTPQNDDVTKNNNKHTTDKQTSLEVTVQKSRKKPTEPSKFQRKHKNAASRLDFDADQVRRYIFLQSRIYLLSSLIGDRQRPFNRFKGVFGLLVWIINLTIHFSFDFYEANTVFHVSWASSIGVFLVMFVVSTIFLIRHTLRWFIKTLKKLSKDKIYKDTMSKLHFVFRFSPMGMFVLSVSGAGAQYGCYAYDDALTISFTEQRENGTQVDLVPPSVHVVINILRFTSLMHIYYMMFLLLGFALVIFFTIVHSQKLFNEHIGNELKAHPPSMSFQEAVNKVAWRTKLLRSASENTTIIFSTLLLATSLSFVVNAYNFLFIKRYAIYIWFAIAPLVWTVSILIGAAFVTSSYHKLKLVVMQSWVEIPEKYDEMWSRRTPSARQGNAAAIRPPSLDWRAGLENVRRRKAEREAAKEKYENDHVIDIPETNEKLNDKEQIKDNDGVIAQGIKKLINITSQQINNKNTDHKDTTNRIDSEYDNVDSSKQLVGATTTAEESSYKSVEEGRETTETGVSKNDDGHSSSVDQLYTDDASLNEGIRLQELETISASKRRPSLWKKTMPSILVRKATTAKAPQNRADTEQPTPRVEFISKEINNGNEAVSRNEAGNKTRVSKQNSEHFVDVVRIAQGVNKFTVNTKKVQIRRKFNYEKYIKYLELTLDTVGFTLGKVIITWDRVSFFIVLLMTFVGAFAQNAFLK